jgi:thiol-disulfide isomerase/thioredoxin
VDFEGNKIQLTDFIGKPIVLNFWASWCGPCRLEMPEFQAAFEDLGDEVTFMMVNLTDGDRETPDTCSIF